MTAAPRGSVSARAANHTLDRKSSANMQASPTVAKVPSLKAEAIKRGRLTAEGRKKLSLAAKKRWALAKRKGINAITGKPWATARRRSAARLGSIQFTAPMAYSNDHGEKVIPYPRSDSSAPCPGARRYPHSRASATSRAAGAPAGNRP
jgi:hypothetical protein